MANAVDAAYYNDEFYLRVYMGHKSRYVHEVLILYQNIELHLLTYPSFTTWYQDDLVMSSWYVAEILMISEIVIF